MNIETIGALRKALSKYSDETPLEFAELEHLTDEDRKKYNVDCADAVIPFEVVKVSDDISYQEDPNTGTKTNVATIEIKKITVTLEEAQKLER